MRIALLGGSFNPPHNGHLVMARAALAQIPSDEVWLLPNFRQSPPKEVASPDNRLAMTKLLEGDRIRVSTIEIDNKLSGETIEILPFLPKEHAFSFVIGSDLLPGLLRWQEYKRLLAVLPFWVYPRAGFPLAPMYPGMRVLQGEPVDASSTEIRTMVAADKTIRGFVPGAVAQYIEAHKLYR